MTAGPQRLLYLTQWFAPEPVAIPVWVADALQRRGWDIEVVTAFPNYPEGVVHEGYNPKRFLRDHAAGYRVTRTPVYASRDSSAVRRMLSYFSWAVTATPVAVWRSRGRGASLVYSSPATAALPAMVARILTGRRYVLFVQDIWPDSVTAAGFIRNARLLRSIEWALTLFVNASYRLANTVVVISSGARRELISRGVPQDKIAVVHNWVDEAIMRPQHRTGELRSALGLTDEDFLLMYAGTLGPAQTLGTAIEAIAATTSRAHLVLVGAGVERHDLEAQAESGGTGRIHFIDPVPLDKISTLMADADAQLISLAPDPVFEVTLPSKIQSTLAAGSVCIGAVSGDAAAVLNGAGSRTSVPGDASALARAIDEVAALTPDERMTLRARARRFYEKHLSEDAGASRLSDILTTATGRRNGRER